MERDDKIPLLLSFYFGEAAGRAQGGASRRLVKWSRAFEAWMDERGRKYEADTVKQSRMAWRRLARQCQKMPWEMRREDIEAHIEWMMEEGFAASTINCAVGIFESFYRWCDEREVDRACGKGFNPAREAKRLKVGRYEGAGMWSDGDVEVLMELAGRDMTPLGRRDFAFFTARLMLGVPLKSLLRLEWGMLKQDDGAWVRWRQDGAWMRLPGEVWEAIEAYLQVSGRLEGMEAGKFIFAPLATPGKENTGSRAEDWLEHKPVSQAAILGSLKVYGRRVGIEEGKLNFMALRRTAMRMKLDEGLDREGMKVWLDSQEEAKFTRYRLKMLEGREEEKAQKRWTGIAEVDQPKRKIDKDAPLTLTHPGKHRIQALPPGRGDSLSGAMEREKSAGGGQQEVPVRKAKPFREGEGVTHGIYKRRVDPEKIKEVMRENIIGVDEEMQCFQELMKGMLKVDEEQGRLMEAYSQAMGRMQVLVAHKESPENREAAEWVVEVTELMADIGIEMGLYDESEREQLKEVKLDDEAEPVREMVASMRLMLRNIYQRVMEGVDDREYLRLVELYGRGCVRLSRMLRAGGDEYVRIRQKMWDQIDEGIRQAGVEMGILPADGKLESEAEPIFHPDED